MLKRVVFGLTHRCGVNAAVRHTLRRRLLTLCYHSVLPDAEIGTSHVYRNTVGVEELRQQLEILATWYEFASPDAVLDAAEGRPLPRPSVLITFDDGHASLLTHAAPLLQRMGIPAVFHVTTGHIGTGTPLWTEELAWIVAGWRQKRIPLPSAGQSVPVSPEPAARATLTRGLSAAAKRLANDDRLAYLAELRSAGAAEPPAMEREAFRFLDWHGVRDLQRRGFAIGSHTVDHSILSRTDRPTLDRELALSKRRIETELSTECPWIAYPNGTPQDVSPTVFERARAAAYRIGFTTFGGFDHPRRSPLAIGRICVPGGLSSRAFRAMTSGVQHWLDRVRGRRASAGRHASSIWPAAAAEVGRAGGAPHATTPDRTT